VGSWNLFKIAVGGRLFIFLYSQSHAHRQRGMGFRDFREEVNFGNLNPRFCGGFCLQDFKKILDLSIDNGAPSYTIK